MFLKSRKIIGLGVILAYFFFLGKPVYAQEEKVSVSVSVEDTAFRILGWSFPGAYITITENGAVIGTVLADQQGYFIKELFTEEDGEREIGLYAINEKGETTLEAEYEVEIERGVVNTLLNIVLPPTISISATEIVKGNTVDIYGYGPSHSTINMYIDGVSVGSVKSDSLGYFKYSYDTDNNVAGEKYRIHVTASLNGVTSQVSKKKSLSINATESTLSSETSERPTSTPAPEESISPTSRPAEEKKLPEQILKHYKKRGNKIIIEDDQKVAKEKVVDVVIIWIESWKEFLTELREVGYVEELGTKKIEETKESQPAVPAGKKDRPCDIDKDSFCDLIDFSILLYYIY